MADINFPQSFEKVVAALIELFRHQNRHRLIEILKNTKGKIELTEEDNWNEGTYYYSLFLEIPFKIFATIEPRLESFEKEIKGKLPSLLRGIPKHHINEVTIGPDLEEVATPPQKRKPTQGEADRIWEPGFLKLFLSHISAQKKEVSVLKGALQTYGVSAFVAHEDIEPSLEWQQEIELALDTMDALAALITPNFKHSLWVDQEIGVAFGKGVFVIPVKLGLDPYGFLAKQQGLPGDLSVPSKLASDIVDVLLKQKKTASIMRESLVIALERSDTFATSKKIATKLDATSGFSREQIRRLEEACDKNYQVSESFGVPQKIKAIAQKHGYFSEDDIPF